MTEAIKFIQKHGIECATEIVNENKGKLKIFSTFEMDLKRLVESHERLNEEYGTLENAKEHLKTIKNEGGWNNIASLIADAEECQ